MRNSPKVEPVEVNGEIIGFALSADFTAEHEQGIKEIKSSFNIDNTTVKEHVQNKLKNFVKKLTYKIPYKPSFSKNSQNLYIVKNKSNLFLCSKESYNGEKYEPKKLERFIYISDKDFAGSWDESEFAICAKNTKENLALFEMLIQAEKENDVFIGFFPEVLRQGLLVIKGSKIPKETLDNYAASVQEMEKMYVEAFESKIFEILQKAGKKWFYLEPKFYAGEKGFHSAYNDYPEGTLLFWLNPMDQQTNASGYFSIEELLHWAKNEGPVVERKKKELADRAVNK